MRRLSAFSAFLCLLFLPPVAFAAPASSAHDKAFWKDIAAHDYALPTGASAMALATELAGLAASTDPELRDEYGYDILARWIHRGVLTPQELDALRLRYLTTATMQLGSAESDAIFGRSFSLLALKELASADLKAHFLTQQTFDELFDLAEKSLSQERDLRGYVEGKGWAHATAHTGDLIRTLARNPKLTAAQQARLIDAVIGRVRSANLVFVWGEDRRLATAIATLLQRQDANPARLDAWRIAFTEEQRTFWNAPFELNKYRRLQAQFNTLAALCAIVNAQESPGLPAEMRTALCAPVSKPY